MCIRQFNPSQPDHISLGMDHIIVQLSHFYGTHHGKIDRAPMPLLLLPTILRFFVSKDGWSLDIWPGVRPYITLAAARSFFTPIPQLFFAPLANHTVEKSTLMHMNLPPDLLSMFLKISIHFLWNKQIIYYIVWNKLFILRSKMAIYFTASNEHPTLKFYLINFIKRNSWPF